MINHPLPRSAWTVLACAALAACGGGTTDAVDPVATTADAESRATIASSASAGAVRLASANAAGTPGDISGQVCAISADAQQVLMRSASSNLVPGDSNFQDDLFLKNLATGAVTRVNTSATGVPIVSRLTCHGMSQDGTWVAFTADSGGSGQVYVPGPEVEATLMCWRRPKRVEVDTWTLSERCLWQVVGAGDCTAMNSRPTRWLRRRSLVCRQLMRSTRMTASPRLLTEMDGMS